METRQKIALFRACHRAHWSAQHAQMRKSPRDVGQAIKDALPAEAAELFEEARDFGGYCH